MVRIILLAAAVAGTPDSANYRAVVRPESAVFEFPVQYDPAWTIEPAHAPEYEWTVSTVVGDTVFSFGYVFNKESYAGAPAGAIKFADARTRFGDRRLSANGSVDPAVAVEVAFEASKVVIRLNDAAAIRRVFALNPKSVQFAYRLPGRPRATIDVPVEYEPEPAAPDSTYLLLLFDFPALGTFSYDVASRDRLVNVHTETRAVDVRGCLLAFEVWVQRLAQGQPGIPRNAIGTTIAIPLNAIDAKSLTVRAQHPQANSRYDPQPWLLNVAVKPDTKATIMVGTTETPHKAPTRNVSLQMKDYETALMVAEWLRDGANRCETWQTTPRKPIR